jgi:beta-galactosidase
MPEISAFSPSLGVCYYPEQWREERWPQDFAAMQDLGIRYVRVGEFAWSRLEPTPGRYEFAWLHRVLDLARERGLSVVLGTPTATPPKWLVDRMPDMLAIDAEGRPKRFGSRRHYCFSHAGYRAEAARIVTRIAQEFGQHPAITGWQTDNEYGCHDTVLSYSEAARAAFRQWLRERYGAIDRLNGRWGNVFWSMEYRSFEEIDLPNLTVTEANPAHQLDFRRFSSEQVQSFNRLQVDIIRRLSPGRTILHNFMGAFLGFDHFALAEDLDGASWDSYPLGFLTLLNEPDEHKLKYLRAGDPDFVAFHHDLYRSCGRGRWWVMEQQPGPVNWAAYNPAPNPGMVRFWTHEAIAHGAEVVSYFRWRQAPFAQEQMHAGLNLPDGNPDVGTHEVRQVLAELAGLPPGKPRQGDVALIYDYEAAWALAIQPQGDGFKYFDIVLLFYRSLRRLGFNIDVLPQTAKLDGYKLVVIPTLPILHSGLVEAIKAFQGPILIGPRTGSKTVDFQIPANLPPGLLQDLLPIRVVRVESLPPFAPVALSWRDRDFHCQLWLEHVRGEVQPWIRLLDGTGIAFTHNAITYLATVPGQPLSDAIVEDIVSRVGLPINALPEGVRARKWGSLQYFFNYNPEPVSLPVAVNTRFIVGARDLPVAGVAVTEDTSE